MGLIKSERAPSSLVPFSMKDIENHARQILLRARKQAEDLLAAAQVEAEELKKDAHADALIEGKKEGLAKGLEEGRKSGHTQALNEHRKNVTDLAAALTATAAELNANRHQLESEALREVVELAVSIGRRVTKRQGMIDPDVLAENLVEAMKFVVHAADVRIAIHPAQRAYLLDTLPRLQLEWPALQHVELTDDATLAPGGCRIMTRDGAIDANLDGQLDRVIDELLPTPTGDGRAVQKSTCSNGELE